MPAYVQYPNAHKSRVLTTEVELLSSFWCRMDLNDGRFLSSSVAYLPNCCACLLGVRQAPSRTGLNWGYDVAISSQGEPCTILGTRLWMLPDGPIPAVGMQKFTNLGTSRLKAQIQRPLDGPFLVRVARRITVLTKLRSSATAGKLPSTGSSFDAPQTATTVSDPDLLCLQKKVSSP